MEPQLGGEASAQRCEVRGGDFERQVGVTVQDGLDAVAGVIVHPDIDAVGVAVGLGCSGPLAETLVADEQQPSAGDELGDPVGPGGGDRPGGEVRAGRPGWHRPGRWQCQLEQQVRVWVGQVEDDGAGLVVGDDSA